MASYRLEGAVAASAALRAFAVAAPTVNHLDAYETLCKRRAIATAPEDIARLDTVLAIYRRKYLNG